MAKIVIAEDERDIRELITFTLNFAGHEVIPTTNGAEALEAAKREGPKLVILDVRMPQMTGYEACKAIKADPNLAHIPVAFLSAKGQEGEIQEGLSVGAVAYILKPFAPDDLTQRVQEILDKHA